MKKAFISQTRIKKELLDLTKKLIQFKTTGDNTNALVSCMSYLKKFFAKAGLPVVLREYVVSSRPSLVITSRKTKRPKVFLVGHIDVVEAPVQAFQPKIKNGKLFGRGALDMKSGLAIAILAFRETVKENPLCDIGLMVVSDEEVGGFNGVGSLLGKKGYGASFAMALEGAVETRIAYKQKGVCQIKVSVEGIAAHGAYPWLGENAARKLMEVIDKIYKEFPKPRDAWVSTVNLSKIEVPNTALNKIPAKAGAFLDIRFTNELANSAAEIVKRLRKRIPNAKFDLIAGAPLLNTSPNDPYVISLRHISREIYGKPLKLGFSHGASDGRFFSERGIACVEYGPKGRGHHGENEYVEIKSIAQVYQVVKKFLKEVA